MDNNDSHFIEWELIDKSLREGFIKLSDNEKNIISTWLSHSSKHRKFYERANDEIFNADSLRYSDELEIENIKKNMFRHLNKKDIPEIFRQKRQKNRIRMFLWSGAAALFLLLIVSVPLLIRDRTENKKVVSEIPPGTKKATLITNIGDKIDLSNSNGIIDIGYADIQVNNSQIKYSSKKNASKEKLLQPVLNTVVVPRGGEYSVTLPDGTKVWLNSESLIIFPDKFLRDKREVTIAGELFFDVAKDTLSPFIVKTDDFNIHVTGTTFNINSYKTSTYSNISVESGNVTISISEGSQFKIGSGQRLNINRVTKSIDVQNVAPGVASAWKNGWFIFDKEPLASIMEKVSRWYDVEIEISSPELLKLRFSGKVERYKNADKVLDMLKDTDYLNYTLEEKGIKIFN